MTIGAFSEVDSNQEKTTIDNDRDFNPDNRIKELQGINPSESEPPYDPDARIKMDDTKKEYVSEQSNQPDSYSENSENNIDATSSVSKDVNGVPKSELTEEERKQIKEETNWSDEVIDYIKDMDQYEIYKNADLVEVENDGRKCLVKRNLDLDYVSDKTIDDQHPEGISNRELMSKGKSPYDSKTGEKIELHHMSQDFNSPLAELTENSEHGDGNHSVLHDNNVESWRRDPELKKTYNDIQKPNHWVERSKS
ncbi:MAG: HNH/ENDO VII family nuclease [Saccharofermentans sp.]|nr:HNH/ENDO VII family nuclease [Saccharofermentans sp.]